MKAFEELEPHIQEKYLKNSEKENHRPTTHNYPDDFYYDITKEGHWYWWNVLDRHTK
jgi:hypothetical protein